ncbi:hypothetical protein vseg_002590 [Gypsophila vaccaria]
MDFLGDALRQAFMPKHEYQNLRDEEKAFPKLKRPICVAITCILSILIIICAAISLKIVFPGDSGDRPFCFDRRVSPLPLNASSADSGEFEPISGGGAFYLTDQETVEYYYMVLFMPSSLLFFGSSAFLFAGIAVAYSAPQRHGCLKVVENNYCTSKRGGVRCLAIINMIFAIIFGLLALFLGPSLLTLGSSCSLPLFWCYEIASWGLVIFYGATALFLRRKAAVILDDGNASGRNMGLEMLEANPYEFPPDVERRVNEGFKTWMGSSLLSSDDEDDHDEYGEIPGGSIGQSRQRPPST